MDGRKNVGLLGLIRRYVEARRGNVRAMEDLYHLRGVAMFVGVFGATVVVPGLLLAYYGIAGLRAEERAGLVDVERQANATARVVVTDVERIFTDFEEATLNRLKFGQSVTSALRGLSPYLRVVLRFDPEGALVAPFVRDDGGDFTPDDLFFHTPTRFARSSEAPQAAGHWALALREVQDAEARAYATFGRANAHLLLGELTSATPLLEQVAGEANGVRDPRGFRLGDLARLRLGEALLQRSPSAGEAALRGMVDAILAEPWVIGRGQEAAVARRALDLVAGRSNAEWLSRARGALEERGSQAYWAERLVPELDDLGARGSLFRTNEDRFLYQRSETAIWASTWKSEGQYVFALEADALIREARDIAARHSAGSRDVVARVLAPGEPLPAAEQSRQSLSVWLPGWTLVVVARDPDRLAAQRSEERLRGSGIIALSLGMIGLGAVLSVWLVRRELDGARDKSDFAAHVSHELRSPITQIRLKAEALQLGLATDEASLQRHYDVIMREAERLSRLVDNVLDFSAIERGMKKYTLRPGDLGGTVHRAVDAARVAMETRAMTIELEVPEDLPVVWHDGEAVGQVMHNLLSNAAKYGQEAGWIGIRVYGDDTGVHVDVADRGIGIDTGEQSRVFEQYWRSSDPLARRKKGTGIGLTIVRYIMEAHGGRVTLQSAPGIGTTFTLSFPLRAPVGALERVGA